MAERQKITKRTIEAAQPIEGRTFWICDTEVAGFRTRVRPTGRKTYEVRYYAGRRERLYVIGDHGSPWTADEARTRAISILRAVETGADPQEERRTGRAAITVRELIERYLAEGPTDRPNKRASSWETDRINLHRHVLPLLGARAVRDLTGPELARWQRDVSNGKTAAKIKRAPRPSAAAAAVEYVSPAEAGRIVGLSVATLETLRARGNSAPFIKRDGRVLYPVAELLAWAEARRSRNDGFARGGRGCAARAMCSLSAMLSWATRHGLISDNPARHVQKLPTGKRERFLTDGEAKNLGAVVSELEKVGKLRTDVADLFRLLALTGARRNEVLGLRWSEVDFERGLIVLPPDRHKSGATGKPRVIQLDASAVAILRGRQRKVVSTNTRTKRIVPWVFPKQDGKGPIEPPKRAWDMVRKASGLDDLRLHDLRHTYASILLAGGTPLAHVGKALGHTKATTTERYAHLSDDATRNGASVVASIYALPLPRDEESAHGG